MTDIDRDADGKAPIATPADLADQALQLRLDLGLKQREVADRMGCSTSTISKVENFHEGDGMVGTRISVIEALSDKTVEGPLYRQVEEQEN